MENDPDLVIGQRNQCEGMWWFGEHNTRQEVISGMKAGGRNIGDRRSEDRGQRIELEDQRMEAVRSNQKEAGQSNHKVVGWSSQKREAGQSNQKVGGWTVKPEEGWTVKPEDQRREDLGPNEESRELRAEVQTGGAGTGGRRYPEHNPEGHGRGITNG
ncbi:hypothetical protein B0H14DRAFT_2630600 [Mycena olivaceomarginata]|nr:hypothetical protein B0H14DRAFT_2630600 [Mycena olivaceomarginata]